VGKEPEKDGREIASRGQALAMTEAEDWFVREVLPLEAALMHFLLRSRRNKNEADDLRQEIYVRAFEAAKVKIPHPTKPVLFAIARNLLVDRVRHEQVVAIETVADVDALSIAVEEPGPDRSVIARQELRLLEAAIESLPRRCRQVVVLSRLEGLPRREIAQRLGIRVATVSAHLTEGMYLLANSLYSEPDVRGGKS
jgi:RNA polymerase sigma factor (sigma-70 family)